MSKYRKENAMASGNKKVAIESNVFQWFCAVVAVIMTVLAVACVVSQLFYGTYGGFAWLFGFGALVFGFIALVNLHHDQRHIAYKVFNEQGRRTKYVRTQQPRRVRS